MKKLIHVITRRLTVRYRKMSIHMVLSLAFTAVALVGVLFLGMSLLWRFSDITQGLIEENSQRILSQVNMNLDSYLRRMMRVSDTLYYSVIKNTEFVSEDPEKWMGLLYEENRDDLASISLFDENGDLISSVPLNEIKQGVHAEQRDWFAQAIDNVEDFHFSSPHVQNLFDDQHPWVVSLSRQVQLNYQGGMERGVLLVDMNFSGIEQICRNAELFNGGYVYLVSNTGELIYHPRQQLIYAGLMQEYHEQAPSYSDGCHNVNFDGNSYLMTIKTVGYTGWKLVGMVPTDPGGLGMMQIGLFGVSLLLFSAFLMAFLTFHISAHITDPIYHLEESIKRLEN